MQEHKDTGIETRFELETRAWKKTKPEPQNSGILRVRFLDLNSFTL